MKEANPIPYRADLFRNLFAHREFSDRYTDTRNEFQAIDVIVPLLHSTDLWRENLLSYYREIPISRLLIGDGGVIDNSLDVLRDFPRVEVIDHRNFISLGKSISDLISRVETDHFIYLQSDVFLPSNWFDDMWSGTKDFDWYGCPMHITMMMDYPVDYSGSRPLVGSQIGLTKAFSGINDFIDDDFVYRNEEFVFESYAKRGGFRTGAVKSTFHFHQVSRRITNGDKLDVTGIEIRKSFDPNELKRVLETQVFGIVKYCNPDSNETIAAFDSAVDYLLSNSEIGRRGLRKFCNEYGSDWSPYVNRAFKIRRRILRMASKYLTQSIKNFTKQN
jgi:hypothetical protein